MTRTSGFRLPTPYFLIPVNRLHFHEGTLDSKTMQGYIREVLPNNLPMVLQAQLSAGGGILMETVKIIPLLPCYECEECREGNEDYPLSCARLGEPQECENPEHRRKLALRLGSLLD